MVITPGECERKGIRKPAYFDKWVNLKDLYADHYLLWSRIQRAWVQSEGSVPLEVYAWTSKEQKDDEEQKAYCEAEFEKSEDEHFDFSGFFHHQQWKNFACFTAKSDRSRRIVLQKTMTRPFFVRAVEL